MSNFAETSFQTNQFILEKHAAYIKKVSSDRSSFEFAVTQHFRMSGIYWGMTAMSILGKNIFDEMNTEEIVKDVMECQHSCGGYDVLFI